MLYLYHGTDHTKIRKKVSALRAALHKKRPEAEFFKIDEPAEVTQDTLEELAGGQGLFDRKYIVQLDRVLEDAKAREAVVEMSERLAASENMFLVVDGQVDAKTASALAKHAEGVDEFSSTRPATQEMNMFSLADALGSRDRKQLWVLFQKAKRELKEPEEIHGTLFWQVKAMILAGSAPTAAGAGLKQFPYTKAKRFRQNYSDDELNRLAYDLVDLYHQARRGQGDMGVKLERFILSL